MASVFLESIRDFMITRRYAKRTIDTYQYWIKFYILRKKGKKKGQAHICDK
ncbi:hypothetical protein [Pseudoalteromonas mariniglutinosa]|uniref:hypothetical protein n=1 Tax=Pseudoalteromonas mariniglutinosa TaxID=206042 RepID=UPI0038512E83